MRKGELVTTIVPKTGQTPRIGRVVEDRGEFVEVEWEDGHVSTITKASITPFHPQRTSH